MAELVNGNSNYSISKDGIVKTVKTDKKKIKKAWLGKNGYYYLDLYKNNKSTKVALHRLLALQFIPNLEGKRTVNHKDGDKLNNSLSNLEWATYSENTQHAYDNYLNKCTTKIVEEVTLQEIYQRFLKGETLSTIVKDYDFALTTLSSRLKKYVKELGVEKEFLEERRRQRDLINKASTQATMKVLMIDKISKEILKSFDSIREAVVYLNRKSSGPISNAISGRAKSAYGYCWEKA